MVDLDDNTLLDLHIYSDLTQPHPIIIIHLKYFIQKVLSTIDGKFTQVRMTLLASPSSNSGYKGIFSKADSSCYPSSFEIFKFMLYFWAVFRKTFEIFRLFL